MASRRESIDARVIENIVDRLKSRRRIDTDFESIRSSPIDQEMVLRCQTKSFTAMMAGRDKEEKERRSKGRKQEETRTLSTYVSHKIDFIKSRTATVTLEAMSEGEVRRLNDPVHRLGEFLQELREEREGGRVGGGIYPLGCGRKIFQDDHEAYTMNIDSGQAEARQGKERGEVERGAALQKEINKSKALIAQFQDRFGKEYLDKEVDVNVWSNAQRQLHESRRVYHRLFGGPDPSSPLSSSTMQHTDFQQHRKLDYEEILSESRRVLSKV